MKLRNIGNILALVLTLSLMTGCGNRTDKNDVAKKGNKTEVVKDYLSKPLHIVVPYAPGGGADIANRIIAKYLEKELKTTVVVDNKPGAGGIVASTQYLNEKPNTRTLLYTNSSLMSYVPKFQKTAYKREDFKPVFSFQILKFALYSAPKNTGIKTMADLQKFAKTNRIIFGSPGIGKPLYGTQEKIYTMMGSKNKTVTYKTGNQGIINLISGDTNVLATELSIADQFVKQGSIVPLGMLSKENYDGPYGKIPSTYNSGYKMSNDMLTMFVIRKGTDQAIADKLYQALKKVNENKEFIAEMNKAQNAQYKIMDEKGINQFLDETDKISETLLKK